LPGYETNIRAFVAKNIDFYFQKKEIIYN